MGLRWMPINRKVYNSNLYYKMQYLMNKDKIDDIQNQTEFIFNNKSLDDSNKKKLVSKGTQAKLEIDENLNQRQVKSRATKRDKPSCVALVI